MALKGNLHDFSFTQLLNLIHLARKTGTLAIDGRGSAARIAFRLRASPSVAHAALMIWINKGEL